MRPGEHLIIVGTEENALQARLRGLHLRDTLTILLPGPRSLWAFLFRAPLDGTLAKNVLGHGCGGLNIGECQTGDGRWPSNLLLVHGPGCGDQECQPDCPVGLLNVMSGLSRSVPSMRGERHGAVYGGGKGPTGPDTMRGHSDFGGASRFFPQFYGLAEALGWLMLLSRTDTTTPR